MKAILVVDINKEYTREIKSAFDCTNCPLYYENQNFRMRCFVDDYITDIKGKCPLKPIPNKRKMPITKTFGTDFNKGQVVGWNDCINEILGEKDERND